jgi:DME family drug/metabolite transporter
MIIGTLSIVLTSIIWGTVIFYYKKLMEKESFYTLNFKRVFSALMFSFPIVVFSWTTKGALPSMLSGVVGLGIGDTLYLYAILKSGASIAAPVAYIYVILSQLTAFLIGEKVGLQLVIGALFAFLGVSLLNKENSSANLKGVVMAFLAGISWMFSAVLIKHATVAEGSPSYIVAFYRLLGATIFLGCFNYYLDRNPKRLFNITQRILPPISFIDMYLGAALYSLGVSQLGVSKTVIIVSLSPAITVIFAKVMRLEEINWYKAIGTILIIAGIVLTQVTG